MGDEPKDFFRPEFVEEQTKLQTGRTLLRDNIWKERHDTRELLQGVVPETEKFFDYLEERDDVQAAIATGCLSLLEAQGLAKNETQFISADVLLRNARVWSLRWTTDGVVGVDRSGDQPKAANQWDEVVLQVQVDREKRRIDTEFFGLNEALGEASPAYDDREKFHIVWELGKDADLRLFYVGLGANEPYDLEHEDRGAPGFSGRPRFFIYDVERATGLRYEVEWLDDGEFDWDWSARSVRVFGNQREVAFVNFPDRSRVCVSDTEVARAAEGYTSEQARKQAERDGLHLTEPEVRARTHRMRAVVKGPIVESLPPEPSLRTLVDRRGFDYVAYFVATTIAGEKPRSSAQLVRAAARLEASRKAEYDALLDRPCKEVFVDEIAAVLPASMRELFDLHLDSLSGPARAAVTYWTTAIAREVRRDLYHYGQSPLARINRLRLCAYLAFSKAHGDFYDKVLEQAKRLLHGKEPFGQFDVSLVPS